jgi:hypothetical protein
MSSAETLPVAAPARRTHTLSLDNARLFWVMLLLSVVPIWFGPYLPAVDLAQHAGQVTALREVLAGNPLFTSLFEPNWFTPYLLAYALLYVFSAVLPITVATQLLVTLAVIALPLSTGALLRSAGADERWKWLAIPASYSFAFYWGFLTFMVAVPLGLLFLVQTWGFVRNPTLRNGLLVAAASITLFFCHLLVLLTCSLFALGIVFGTRYRNLKQLVLQSLPYAAPLPLMALWARVTVTHDSIARGTGVVVPSVQQKLAQFLAQPAGLEYFGVILTPFITLSVALLPILGGARFSRRPERWLPFVLAIVVFVALPSGAFHTGFLYERMGIFVVPLWLMAWDAGPKRRAPADWLAMGVVMLWLASNIGRFAAFAGETHSFQRVIAAASPGKRMGTLMNNDSSRLFLPPVYVHFHAWYQATHRGVVDFNFAEFFPQIVRYRKDAPPRIDEYVATDIGNFDWQRNGGDRYDYFLVKSNADMGASLFSGHTEHLKLIAHEASWWLYQNMDRAQ